MSVFPTVVRMNLVIRQRSRLFPVITGISLFLGLTEIVLQNIYKGESANKRYTDAHESAPHNFRALSQKTSLVLVALQQKG